MGQPLTHLGVQIDAETTDQSFRNSVTEALDTINNFKSNGKSLLDLLKSAGIDKIKIGDKSKNSWWGNTPACPVNTFDIFLYKKNSPDNASKSSKDDALHELGHALEDVAGVLPKSGKTSESEKLEARALTLPVSIDSCGTNGWFRSE